MTLGNWKLFCVRRNCPSGTSIYFTRYERMCFCAHSINLLLSLSKQSWHVKEFLFFFVMKQTFLNHCCSFMMLQLFFIYLHDWCDPFLTIGIAFLQT